MPKSEENTNTLANLDYASDARIREAIDGAMKRIQYLELENSLLRAQDRVVAVFEQALFAGQSRNTVGMSPRTNTAHLQYVIDALDQRMAEQKAADEAKASTRTASNR